VLRLRVAEVPRLLSRFQGRKFEAPTGALGKLLHVLHRVEVGDKAVVGGFVRVNELWLTLDPRCGTEIPSAQVWKRFIINVWFPRCHSPEPT
jgi:hypothetical protein